MAQLKYANMAQLNVCKCGPIKCMQMWPNLMYANVAQLNVCKVSGV